MKRMCVAVVMAALLAGGGAASGRAATLPLKPKLLVLKKTDVPAGFTLARSGPISITQAAINARVTAEVLKAHGRLAEYAAIFVNNGKAPGLRLIQSTVSTWKTTKDGHWAFGQTLLVLEKKQAFRFHRVTAPRLGKEDAGLRASVTVSGVKSEYYHLLFHRDDYLVDAVVAGTKGVARIDDALRFAKIIDKRIQAAATAAQTG